MSIVADDRGAVILTDDRGAVRIITLNRPDVRNAIDIPLRLALREAIDTADADTAVRAIVLTGAGSVFCSGGDIATMQRMDRDAATERAESAQAVIRAIWSTPKPVLAAVEGAAYGAGTSLAAACDRVVAAADARFATTFTNVGLAGDMGVFASLPRRIGIPRARQMLTLGTPVDARQAFDWGLVDALAEPGAALDAALADAERLAVKPPAALGVIKTMLAEAPTLHPYGVLSREAAYQAELFGSDDFAEGVAAYREKRRPVFGQTQGGRS
ncbi:enoyl-CoA hydratase/isomerase family protein [Mycolicibacterium parafortuitum]|uniref:Enoyl-CoA hydratase [Bordetella petrii DSM] n=1 Tax=Mycolicibacterium parafortuitum TaxID=39692 RepID=A0A375YLJ3_MYCPF|nr:enoyl-CoA hydratase-related protein [Mycolicibacterium parafortuitum]ORB30344.1 enoyl-CoA hydratase [Mycolicibacterium parafortuitum]SRX81982.1 enoyl-CoA hydratase [Bordetella petrii DSM] [Mycolicibacterium parafortuitum]